MTEGEQTEVKTEIWEDILGYEKMYQVSNFGRVKALTKICNVKAGGVAIRKERIITNLYNEGYMIVGLTKNKKLKRCSVHRLVAMAFISNPECKSEVNHINGKKHDNRVENLEWCTKLENVRHALVTGLTRPPVGPKNEKKKIHQLSLTGDFIKEYPSIKDTELCMGFRPTHLYRAIKLRNGKYMGFIWKRAL